MRAAVGSVVASDSEFGLLRHKNWPVDIYLSSHTFQNYTEEKLTKRAEDLTAPNPFIDPKEWKNILTLALNMGHALVKNEEEGKIPEWQTRPYADMDQSK